MIKTSLFNEALDAYNEFMPRRNAHIFTGPEQDVTEIDDDYVYLANRSSGLLAKYDRNKRKIVIEK